MYIYKIKGYGYAKLGHKQLIYLLHLITPKEIGGGGLQTLFLIAFSLLSPCFLLAFSTELPVKIEEKENKEK